MAVNPQYRQKFHFMAETGWINDPNGLIFLNGEFHLFYQYHPFSSKWGPMHWGHSTSTDLIHWKHLPIALTPDRSYDQDGCFSGSAIEKDGLIHLFYTGNHDFQTQCHAVSTDGRTFVKNASSPLIQARDLPPFIDPAQIRDPKIVKVDTHYYMLLGALTRENQGVIVIYRSEDLLNFQYHGIIGDEHHRIGQMWECPDFFELGSYEILLISPQFTNTDPHYATTTLHGAFYAAGKFDLENNRYYYGDFQLLDEGFDFYAPQTWLDDQGRRIMIAWMDMWESDNVTHRLDHGWSGCMTFPREITICNGRLIQKPVTELLSHRRIKHHQFNTMIQSGAHPLGNGICYDLELVVKPISATYVRLKLREDFTLTFDRHNRHLTFESPRGKKTLNYALDMLNIRVLSDVSSIELFIDDGKIVFSSRIFTENPSDDSITLISSGKCLIESYHKYNLEW